MKKQIVGVLLGGMGLLLFLSLNQGSTADEVIPEEIGMILKSSCYDCHTSGARSEDAKKAVQYDLWDDYSVTKKIAILGKIGEVIEEDKMPPQKYQENKPDRKLTEDQKMQLLDWSKKESGRLMQGN
ncbi:MAG: hypothetical protein E4H10_14770 [Bacteroidia bacterium]|nr:MAG: hypothetical protein E4H10_14770 [Bacteroidia bacterium]